MLIRSGVQKSGNQQGECAGLRICCAYISCACVCVRSARGRVNTRGILILHLLRETISLPGMNIGCGIDDVPIVRVDEKSDIYPLPRRLYRSTFDRLSPIRGFQFFFLSMEERERKREK
ncbi:hypothetical protein PUN28_003028 [Cardiocondyla obscurior]|uniref:Uncharacterized protein n=1 Tax=Cardiocondyla obscurior TaxID=286306 RepID=A0AAW2GXJ8_9HYME